MARKKYSDELKANAISMLFAGNTASYVSKQLKIPVGTLRSWKAEVNGSRSSNSEIATQKKGVLGELILGVLEKQLILLQTIADTAANPEWIEKQAADDLAIFYGVITDKSQRLIEAMSGGNNEQSN